MYTQLTTKRYIALGKHVTMEGYAKGKSFVPHGDVTMAYPSGKLELTGSFVVGKATGKWLRWYENGNLQSEHHYTSGLLHGPHKQYWEDGVLAREGAFVRGALDGDLNINDRKGNPRRHHVYKKRKIVSARVKVRDVWFETPWAINATKICYLNQQEQLKCVTPHELWQQLNTLMSPEDVERMMRLLDDLYAALGLDQKSRVLTACGGTVVATKVQEAAELGVSTGRRGEKKRLMSPQEIDEIVGACRASVTASLESRGIHPNVPGDLGTQAAKNQISDQVGNCHDSDSMIADDSFGDTVDAVVGVIEDFFYESDRDRDEATDPHPGTDYEDSYNKQNHITTVRVTISGITRLRFYKSDGSHAGPERYETSEDRGEPSGWVFPLWPSPSMPVDETGRSKCERLADWWETTVEFCENEQWTPYRCQEILRTFTGCADPALVMPTPDGSGVVCPQDSGMTDAEFRRLECKRKSMIMGTSMTMVPTGFGSELCIDKGELNMPEMDICSNPAAMCAPIETIPSEEGIGGYRSGMVRPQGLARTRAAEPSRGNAPKSLNSYTKLNGLNDEGFDAKLKGTKNKVNFVVFASRTCEPCHKVLDVFQEAASSGADALFHYVDVSQNPELYRRFGIRFTPTIVVMKNGAAIGQRRVGAASRAVLSEYVKRSIELGKSDQKVTKTNA